MTQTSQLPPLPTPEEMQQWDNAAIAHGIAEFTLMENAARAALSVLVKSFGPLESMPILLFMGSGNNGGDAAALARHLMDIGAKPLVLHVKKLNTYKGTCAKHVRLSKSLGVPFLYLSKFDSMTLEHIVPKLWQKPKIVIDGLLGTGFKGPLRSNFIEYINLINNIKCFTLALDIPSGLCALEGKVEEVAVKAHATICFAAAKPGLIMPKAKYYTGKLFVQSIGIPISVVEKYPASFNLLSPKSIASMLPQIPHDSYKNTWGHVLILGGSKNLEGAALLAARAAMRSGAGLVTIAAPNKICASMIMHPDIMTFDLGDDYHWPNQLPASLVEKLQRFSALVIGPGLGTKASCTEFIKNLLAMQARPRAVIDADAINILAQNKELLCLLQDDDILTPHPGEAANLLGISNKEVQVNRVGCLQKLTSLAPCTWVLKGATTLLAKGTSPIAILPYDIPNLAVAGSGDVLSGCIAAYVALKPSINIFNAACIGLLVHAHAGHIAKSMFPNRGNMASDIIELLPQAMANISDFPEVYHVNF